MTMRNPLKAFLLATVCMMPLPAFAADEGGFDLGSAPASAPSAQPAKEFDNEIGLWLQGVTGSNTGLSGRYNGETTKGLNLLGEFAFHSPKKTDSTDTTYWSLTGSNLNFQTGNRFTSGFGDQSYMNATKNNLAPDSSIDFRIGKQGTWSLRAYYDSISYTGNIIDSLYTVNGATATLNNGLAAWGGASPSQTGKGHVTAFTVPGLTPYFSRFQVGTRRDILGGEGKYIWHDWTITASVRHEHKEGTMEESLRETYGGQAFAMPINYDTDRYDLSAAYSVPTLQSVIQYTYSRFTDNNASVSLPYPVSATSAPYAETGIYSLPPSTDAHYLTAMVGYNPTPSTRINLNMRVGLELQNASFTPNTGDPNISASTFSGFAHLNSMLQGTSANSLNASATVYQGNFTVTSSLTNRLDGHIFASVDGRNVSLNQFKVWIGGSSPDANATTAVYVVPQHWAKEKVGGEVSYKIWPAYDTKLTVGYRYDYVDRSNAQVGHSDTSTASVDLSSNLGPQVLAKLSYEYSNRSGVLNYATPWGNLEGGTGADGAPSGAYYQAPMTSNAVKFRLDYSPSDIVSGGVFLQYRDENYNYPSVTGLNLVNRIEGIKQDRDFSVGPDLSYRPFKDVDAHVFYTYEQIFYDNLGNGACAASATGLCAGSAGYFRNDYTSGVSTVGASLEWKVNKKLKLSGDYTYSTGSVAFSEYNGVWVSTVTQLYQNVTNYPDINSVLHSLRLNVKYQVTPAVELSAAYTYSMFKNNDWNDLAAPAQATTFPGSTISILTPGYASPNYDVSMFMAGVVMRF